MAGVGLRRLPTQKHVFAWSSFRIGICKKPSQVEFREYDGLDHLFKYLLRAVQPVLIMWGMFVDCVIVLRHPVMHPQASVRVLFGYYYWVDSANGRPLVF